MSAATATTTAFQKIPNCRISVDCFDVCKHKISCLCELAQTPTHGCCDSIFAYNIKKVVIITQPLLAYVLSLGNFKGNIWTGDGTMKVNVALFNEKANSNYKDE